MTQTITLQLSDNEIAEFTGFVMGYNLIREEAGNPPTSGVDFVMVKLQQKLIVVGANVTETSPVEFLKKAMKDLRESRNCASN
jgi:hypothetical protein